MSPNNVLGIVLAGGKSLRFGSDKALADYKGTSFIERSASLLKILNLSVTVVTRRGMHYSFGGCTILEDIFEDKGPLGGIYTAMKFYKNQTLLVLTCDMPVITMTALQHLLDSHVPGKERPVFFSIEPGRLLPFPGIYPGFLFSAVQQNLFHNKLSMKELLGNMLSKKILQSDESADIFSNINEAKDLEKLLETS